MLGLGSDVLVPLKLDLTHGEGRLLDSFTWSLHGHSHTHSLTLEQFAWHTCLDLNLPSELVPRIVAQLEEQLEAFRALESLVHSLAHSAGEHSALWERLSSVVTEVCVRSNVIEYQDCFVWDASACVSACVSECARAGVGVEPEDFARQTCLDLGLPAEMQPVIAARVRETVLKSLLDALEKSDVLVDPSSAKDTVSRISLKLLQPKEVVAQVSELWTQAVPRGKHRVKEAGFEAATVPSSQSNASIWL